MVRLKVVIFAALLAGIMFAQAGRAQTISVVQGNGQVICDLCTMSGFTFFDPLIVKVTDAGGNPVPNAQVTWTITATTGQVAGTLGNPTTVTGSTSGSSAVDCNAYNTSAPQKTGETCNVYTEGSQALAATNNNVITTVQASYSGQSVTFTLTQSPFARQGYSNASTLNAQIAADSPLQIGASISGAVGTVSSSPIKVLVQTLGGTPVSGVSVRLIPDSSSQGGAAIACQTPAGSRTTDPGSILTIGDGTALCYPVFTAAGSLAMNFDILVGGVVSLVNPNSVNSFNKGIGQPAGFAQFGPFHVTATANTAASLQVVSGNNQSANAGAALQPLVVQVLDSGGHALTGVPVTWAVSPSNAATITPSGSSDSNGKAQASVTLASSATGTVTVTATAGSLSQPFSITVNATTTSVTSLTKVQNGADGQSAQQGMAFGTPLTVMASSSAGPVSGAPVSFAVTGGSGTVSASGGSPTQSVVVPTGSNGQASVTATAGSSPGPLTITASVSGFSQTFSLTVSPPAPPVNTSSFLNGAGFFATVPGTGTAKALSPCGVATLVVGSPLAPAAYPLTPNMYASPVQPANVSVSFQGQGATATINAAILNVATASTGQQLITFQVPCEVPPSYPTVNVATNGSTVAVQGVEVRPGAPGIFESPGSDGVRRAVAVRPDGSFVSSSNPARRNETTRIYITGAGPVFPALTTPSPALPQPGIDSTPTDPNQVVVGLNSSGVGAVMVRAAPNLIGVYEVTFTVPASNVQPGDNVLSVGVTAEGNPEAFSQASKLPIQ